MLLTYGNKQFEYDGLGLRRLAKRNNVTTKYVWDIMGMGNILMETDANNQPLYYYIHGLGLIARVKASNNTKQFYHYDFRGSTIAITDDSETITHQYSYAPYGAIYEQTESANEPNPFKYVGQWGVMDEGDSLYYMRARYYDVETRRFLSEDPVWHENLYVYADGNPNSKVDPSGQTAKLAVAYVESSGKVLQPVVSGMYKSTVYTLSLIHISEPTRPY